MGIAHDVTKAVGNAARNVHAGVDKLVSRRLASSMAPQLLVRSPAFGNGARLPICCTADGAGIAPALGWTREREDAQTKSFVIVCEDPDAPFPEPFVHWIAYGIAADATSLDPRTTSGFKEGKNSKLAIGFTPAAPPAGHGVHHYHFQVFALDTLVDLEPGLGRSALLALMNGHVLAWGELVGTYEQR
jgi:Raf kinase inhibitor-like YbhB/YbcL family protein